MLQRIGAYWQWNEELSSSESYIFFEKKMFINLLKSGNTETITYFECMVLIIMELKN